MSTQETGSNESPTQPATREAGESTEAVSGTEQAGADELSLDLIFEILKNERRREVIRYLRDHEKQVTLSDLAEHIAALENDTDVASITSSQRKRVYVGLYQCHLPKMADMGIVQFNQNRGIVSLGENAPQLYQYFDNHSEDDRDWHRYYLGLSGAGAAGFVASLVIGGGATAIVLGLLCAAFGVCSGYHTLTRQREEED